MIAGTIYVISQVIIPGCIIIRNHDTTASCRAECRYLLTTDYYLRRREVFHAIIQSLFIFAANLRA